LLCFLTYLLTAHKGSTASWVLLIVGVLRTLTCGGWTYVTSTDDHDWHDIFMISYLVLTIPWTTIRIWVTPNGTKAKSARRLAAGLFYGTLIPLIIYFIRHKVHRIPGAYTIYAFFEWSLIILDLLFDAATVYDFDALEIQVVDIKGITMLAAEQAAAKRDFLPKSTRKHHGFGYWQFMVSVLNWFVFWSVLTSLPLLIWYFPLWHMGISGYEAILVSIVSPVVLVFPGIRNLFAYVFQLPFLGMALGVAAYLVHNPELRLETVGVACFFGCIALAVQFWGISARPFAGLHRGTAFSLGLILSSIAKFAFYTNNPIWPIMHDANGGWNKTGITIAVLSALLSSRLQYSSGQTTGVAGKRESAVGAGIGVGGLLFALHTLLSDSSTLTLWVWEGYPVRGPLPVPHGLLTIAAMCFGAYLGVTKRTLVGNYRPYMLANVGAFIFYSCNGWLGYIGGLGLTIHLVSIVPTILESAGRHHPAVSFGVGFFVLVLFYLAHVWVVAYAFVPGGPLFREHTDYVLIAQQIAIGIGVWAHKRIRQTAVNELSANTNNMSLVRKIRSQVVVAITVVLALSSAIAFKRFHRDDPKPYHPGSKMLTAGIWTIHFGLDNDMWASEGRMRDVINELEIDVIGFLESDTQRAIMGHRDLTQQIAEELGYYADFGPGPNKHTWGCALLSKFPILNSTHHLLSSPVGELAPAIHATLDVYGKNVDVVVFHSGQEEDVEDRRLQSQEIADITGGSSNPTILLSYLVTKPLQGNYNTYVSARSGLQDIDPSDWDRWCEYILYKDIKRTAYARVSRSTITDTEIQVGKFVVGPEPDYSNNRIDESVVPEDMRFPALFRGQGVRGHRYHVFDEPRYFS
jgi:endonuclease/exonuclease/phosphatase family metal-dependent hydrolase